MDMLEAFNAEIYVPNITSLSSIDITCRDLKLFSTENNEHATAMNALMTSGVENSLSIGIKKLIMIAEMARQDVDKVDKFVNAVIEEGAGRRA